MKNTKEKSYLGIDEKNLDISQFSDYCLEFYGLLGIYSSELNGGFDRATINKAISIYLLTLTPERTWGGGDSLDRERVREILEVLK